MNWNDVWRKNRVTGDASRRLVDAILEAYGEMKLRFLLLCCALSNGFCLAQDVSPPAYVPPPPYVPPPLPHAGSQKEYATRMFFAMTYGFKKECYSGGYPDLLKLETAIDRFREVYPDIMDLVDKSPYLGMSGKDFEKFLDQKMTPKLGAEGVDPYGLFQDCKAGTDTLNGLVYAASLPSGASLRKQFILMFSE